MLSCFTKIAPRFILLVAEFLREIKMSEVFNMLSDGNREIRQAADSCLSGE